MESTIALQIVESLITLSLKMKKSFTEADAIKYTNKLNAQAIITPFNPPKIAPNTLFRGPNIKPENKELINLARILTTKSKTINIIIAATESTVIKSDQPKADGKLVVFIPSI